MLYDDQAGNFDKRAGLPRGAVESIIAALVRITAARAGSGFWLEIGAGTGEIGAKLMRLPIRYFGFDSSSLMLEEFRKRTEIPSSATLMQADGNLPWPVTDGSVDVFFSSRALHLLEADHVMGQLQRAGNPNGWLLLTGKVRRDESSPKFAMRKQMRKILEQHGYQGRGEKSGGDCVLAACQEKWGNKIPSIKAASWKIPYAPNLSIQSWRGKQGLAGVQLPEAAKEAVLKELVLWAEKHFGDISRTLEMEEWYELNGLVMAPP